jgi:hypothetical protein
MIRLVTRCAGDGRRSDGAEESQALTAVLVARTKTGPNASGSNHASSGGRSALARMLLMVKKLASINSAVARNAARRP